jgi:hypothetical protein
MDTVYLARFAGRDKGALGVRRIIEHLTAGTSEAAARLKLYDWFQDIHGTVQLTPLVLRWRPVVGSRSLYASQGQYTWATEAEARTVLATMLETNGEARMRETFKPGPDEAFGVEAVWCWPGHFDPAVAVGWPDFVEPQVFNEVQSR